MRETTRALAEKTKALALAETMEGDIYSAGYANLLEMPEFYDIDVTRSVLELLEQTKKLQGIFERPEGEETIHVLLCEELEQEFLKPCGLVFTHFQAGPRKGALGVIGSCRLNYSVIFPTLRYFGNLISEITRNW
jgi:heat-inducible transcriptional repressor